MRTIITVALALTLAAAVSGAKLEAVAPALVAASSSDEMFAEFKAKHGRVYDSPREEAIRRRVFETNMKRANELAKLNPLAQFGMNEFADLEQHEFQRTHAGAGVYFAQQRDVKRDPLTDLAAASSEEIDWRSKGAVTHVKNQKGCGGCYSFSATGNIEGQWFLAGHSLVSLSEQEILSCSTTSPNDGCGGGLPTSVFEWLINDRNGVIETAASYPFVTQTGHNLPACNDNGASKVNGAKISSYKSLAQSEHKIRDYVYAHGPVSIGVDGSSFQTYQGGILTNCQNVQLDHAVLIVGFDLTHSTPYWIIKNSWGVSWGEEGYIRVEYGQNECGLSEAASSAIVEANGPPVPSNGPTPPSPPSPPSPFPPSPPTPSGGNYTFTLCQDSGCSDCTEYSVPQGDCVEEEFLGDSFSATCYSAGSKVDLKTYVGSEQCGGQASQQDIHTDTCYENVGRSSYVKFRC